MKTLAVSLLLGCFIISSGKAQLRTAITGGAQISSVPGNSSPEWDTLNHQYTSRKGFHAGILAEAPLLSSTTVYFRTGMIYTNKGRNFSSSFDSTSGVSTVKGRQFVNYFEFPLYIVYKKDLGKTSRIVAGAGGYAAFLFSGREATSTQYNNGVVNNTENTSLKIPRSQGRYKNMDIGMNAFAGAEFGRLFFNVNFSKGLGHFYQNQTRSGSFRHQAIGASLGVFLNSDKRREAKKRDRDNDGVPDIEDDCPREKGSIVAKGCPDKDNDGVPDRDDFCPNLAGTANRKGCPAPDSDRDGVNDDEDKCLDVKGPKENNGCPETDEDLQAKMEGYAKRIQFKYKSTSLSSSSKTVLDEVVKVLKRNPRLHVLIEGYTSSDGNGRNHMRLSQARAESVKQYLEWNGIGTRRLKAVGFGDANPVNKGKTEADRALNRRVELKITNL